MRAGERIKEIRTHLGITTPEVEEHSRAIAEAESRSTCVFVPKISRSRKRRPGFSQEHLLESPCEDVRSLIIRGLCFWKFKNALARLEKIFHEFVWHDSQGTFFSAPWLRFKKEEGGTILPMLESSPLNAEAGRR